MSAPLWESYIPYILYGDSTSGVVHGVGTSHAPIDYSYTWGYVDYLFGGSNSGFLGNRQRWPVRLMYDAFPMI